MEIKTKVLLCRQTNLNENTAYLNGFSPDLGYVSFLTKIPKRKTKSSLPNINTLIDAVVNYYDFEGQKKAKMLEFEQEYVYSNLICSPEGQYISKILTDLAIDLSLEHDDDFKLKIYKLLVHAFYALDFKLGKSRENLLQELLRILVITELKMLSEANYIHSFDDKIIRDLSYGKSFEEFFSFVLANNGMNLYKCRAGFRLVKQAKEIIERYTTSLLDKNYNNLSEFYELIQKEEEMHAMLINRGKN